MNHEQGELNISFRAPGEAEWRGLASSASADPSDAERIKKAKDDLNNVLLVSLQTQNLVVLAGCGCSLSADGPSMQDLWNAAVGEKASDATIEISQKVNHSLKDANIEAFLSKVESFLQINEDVGVREFLNSSKQAILDKCSAFLDPEKLDAHKTFLHRISRRRVRDPRLRIFTTNYDLCFERAANELGAVSLDGFSLTAPRQYDPHFFGYDIVRRPRSGDSLGNYLEGVFLLYKLHGSVNWARGNRGEIYEKPNPKPEEACLIYPASGKYQQSFVQPHLESMAQYLIAVREPNTCLLVVGFGFNDDHLAEPLLSAVQSNPHLRVIIVDLFAHKKAKDEDDNRYWSQLHKLSSRGEDVWFIKASFLEFAQLIPDLKSLTPAETLMKAIKGVAG